MPLSWHWPAEADRADLGWIPSDPVDRTTPEYVVAPVTETLVFLTIPLGINRIEGRTVDEFIERLTAMQDIVGPFMHRYDAATGKVTPRPLTAADVRDHLGLSTNASSKTKRQFSAYLGDLRREQQEDARRPAPAPVG